MMRAGFKGGLNMKLSETTSQHTPSVLDDVLVLSVRKSFWASRECEIFPNRVYTKILYGYSQNLVNSFFIALKGLVYIIIHRPKLIFFGSVPRIVPWFINLKRIGFLSKVKLVATNQVYFSNYQAQFLDKIIEYSRGEISDKPETIRDKYVFFPLPGDGDFDALQTRAGDYIFSGGGALRDFASLIDAVRGLDVTLKIVTFSPKTLGYTGELPDNCKVYWKMPLQEFLEMIAGAKFVVVPIYKDWGGPLVVNRSNTTVIQALCLGKAVITTWEESVDEYVAHGREGLLVPEGDVDGYRQAILRLLQSPELLESCEKNARIKAQELTYAKFLERLVAMLVGLLGSKV